MKKLFLLSAFIAGILSAPMFFVEEEKAEFSHASASIVDFLPSKPTEVAPAKDEIPVSKLCGKDALFADFSETERETVAAAWAKVPCDLLKNLKKIAITEDSDSPRALAGSSSLYLRSDLFSLSEAEKVLIHETGHLVDLGGLTTKEYAEESGFFDGSLPVFADDPSAKFYAISWAKNDAWKAETTKSDFVSRYGATDPFEDFAESFLFYVAYGSAFRELAAENAALARKYDFFKKEVFGGTEFAGEKIQIAAERPWDATRI